jgi:hypothetical protein
MDKEGKLPNEFFEGMKFEKLTDEQLNNCLLDFVIDLNAISQFKFEFDMTILESSNKIDYSRNKKEFSERILDIKKELQAEYDKKDADIRWKILDAIIENMAILNLFINNNLEAQAARSSIDREMFWKKFHNDLNDARFNLYAEILARHSKNKGNAKG